MVRPNNRGFAERLRTARVMRGLTQTQLACKIGRNKTTISHFESINEARQPCLGNLVKLADALDVSTDFLLGRTNEDLIKIQKEQLEAIDKTRTIINKEQSQCTDI